MTTRSTEFKPPYKRSEVRRAYWDGTWGYCIGRPAREHPQYEKALRVVDGLPEERRFDPWWVRSWSDVDAVLAGCWFDRAAGDRVVSFFERVCRHSKQGLQEDQPAGRPVELMDWVAWDIVRPLFGWKRNDGTRRFRKASIWIPKKNSKSFTCSGLGLYLLTKDGEASAQVCAAAGSRKQAGIVWDEAAAMVRMSASKKLRKRCRLHQSGKSITYDGGLTASVFLALASDAGTVEGINASGLIFDEVHVQKDRAFYDALKFSGAARRQFLLIEISTAGVYDPLSLGWEEYSEAVRIHEGSLKNWETFVYIAKVAGSDDWWAKEPGKPDDWTDPENLKRANPGADVCIKLEDLVTAKDDALATPRKQGSFLRYRANIWTNAADRLWDARTWAACVSRLPLEEYRAQLEGLPAWGGLDLSLTNDLTCSAYWFKPDEAHPKHRLWVHFFLPKDNLEELEKQNRAPYREWADAGLLELTDGDYVDYAAVRRRVVDYSTHFSLRVTGYDKYRAQEMIQNLTEVDKLNLIEVPQTLAAMSVPTMALDDFVRLKEIELPDHPILTWMAGNCQAKQIHNANFVIVKADKKVRYKVDGVVAGVIAYAAATDPKANEPVKTSYIAKRRGVVTI
jgi:phage terminase large subunit-like protein